MTKGSSISYSLQGTINVGLFLIFPFIKGTIVADMYHSFSIEFLR